MTEQDRVNWCIRWISRMAFKYGGIIVAKTGRNLDWGQAICREQYGENWAEEGIPDSPTDQDIERMRRWEYEGKHPDWVEEIIR